MKDLIRKILKESLLNTMISDARKELEDFESKYGDILSQHEKLKTKLDKIELLNNLKYSISINRPQTGIEYYYAKVKFPFANFKNQKYPYFNIHIGEKTFIDSLTPDEKEKHIQSIIKSYLLKKSPLD
jgi:hypothetical protein